MMPGDLADFLKLGYNMCSYKFGLTISQKRDKDAPGLLVSLESGKKVEDSHWLRALQLTSVSMTPDPFLTKTNKAKIAKDVIPLITGSTLELLACESMFPRYDESMSERKFALADILKKLSSKYIRE